MEKTRIAITKEFDILTVFYDNNTKVDEEPQTTDSSALEGVINAVKVAAWEFKVLSINVTEMRIFIFKETFPSEDENIFEEIDYTALTAPQQTIINAFIDSL
jgi:hypothetical protein